MFLYILLMSNIIHTDFKVDDLHCSFWANYNGFNQKPTIAFGWYKKFLCKNNLPGYMYRGLLHLFQQTNNVQQIISLMPHIEESFKDDTEIQLLFIKSLQQAGLQTTADERIIKLLETQKDNQELAFHAAQVYLRRKEPENALQTINDYLAHAPERLNNFIFYFLKAQIYMLMDNKQEAIIQLQKSLDIHPSFDKGWLMFGMLHEQLGKMQQAIKGYTTFLEVSESPLPHIQEHLLRLMFKQKIAEAQGQKTSINLSCFEQALLLFKQKKYRQALEKIDDCLLKEPRDNDGKVLKAQILNAMQQTEQALNQCCHWISSDAHNGLWLELAHLIATQEHKEHYLIDQLRAIQSKQPQHLNVALYLADLYARTEQVNQATTQHKRAYQLTSDTGMRAKILAHLAILYYDYDMIDQMEHLAKQAETLQHHFAPLHNVVAYWYATQGNNFLRAQALIDNALAQEPRNPFYIDTQAMIFFKQEQYAQAEELFKKSAQLIPDEPMIIEHLAQCYIKQNKPALALSTLKKGLMYTQNKTKETFNRLIRSIETSVV